MAEQALNEIAVRAIHFRQEARAQLETCDKGRDIAVLQGKIMGYGLLLELITLEFQTYETSRVYFSALEELGQEPTEIEKLEDLSLSQLSEDVTDLEQDPIWERVVMQINGKIESLKSWLLFNASASRDLDVAQGKHKGMTSYEDFIKDVKDEVNHRENEKEKLERDRKESLDFDGPAGEPGIPSAQLQEEETADYDEGLYEEMFEEETVK